MNKIFNKFLIGVLFLLGIMLIPTYKMDAVIKICTPSCGSWGLCSVSCDGGIQYRTCTRDNCSTYSESQSCNTQACLPPPIPVTVTVKVDGVAANKTVLRNSNVLISWLSTGATSCSEGKGRGGTGTTGSFPVNNIQATETFTVTCNNPAHCSGTVIGAWPQTYEGQSCSQFETYSSCLQGPITHGCYWVL